MAKKKLTTAEILAAARAQSGGKPENTDDAGKPAGQTPVAEASAKPQGDKAAPKSTKDILAAARAQAGGTSDDSTAKPSGGKSAPKSTADILAAARAQAGGGTSDTDKPATKSAPAETEAIATPTGDRPSVQDMLKAVREGKPAPERKADDAPGSALPPKPQKPPAAGKPIAKTPVATTRRNALATIILAPAILFSNAFHSGWTLFTAACAAWGLFLARFMMPNVLVEPPSVFKVGPPSDYPPGTVTTKWKSAFAVWIVHAEYQGRNVIVALSSVCTHLGCTPNWLESEQKFKCPCHGSGFYKDGINFEGPAPRPLERHGIRVAPDGSLEVDKSVKFQREMGQWTDSSSFVEIA